MSDCLANTRVRSAAESELFVCVYSGRVKIMNQRSDFAAFRRLWRSSGTSNLHLVTSTPSRARSSPGSRQGKEHVGRVRANTLERCTGAAALECIETTPVMARAIGAGACAMLVVGVAYSERSEPRPALPGPAIAAAHHLQAVTSSRLDIQVLSIISHGFRIRKKFLSKPARLLTSVFLARTEQRVPGSANGPAE